MSRDKLDAGLVIEAAEGEETFQRHGAVDAIIADYYNVEILCKAYLDACEKADVEPADLIEDAYEDE